LKGLDRLVVASKIQVAGTQSRVCLGVFRIELDSALHGNHRFREVQLADQLDPQQEVRRGVIRSCRNRAAVRDERLLRASRVAESPGQLANCGGVGLELPRRGVEVSRSHQPLRQHQRVRADTGEHVKID